MSRINTRSFSSRFAEAGIYIILGVGALFLLSMWTWMGWELLFSPDPQVNLSDLLFSFAFVPAGILFYFIARLIRFIDSDRAKDHAADWRPGDQ